MKKERFSILLSYFDKQMEIVNKILNEVKTIQPTGREMISHQEITKTFENYIEDISTIFSRSDLEKGEIHFKISALSFANPNLRKYLLY